MGSLKIYKYADQFTKQQNHIIYFRIASLPTCISFWDMSAWKLWPVIFKHNLQWIKYVLIRVRRLVFVVANSCAPDFLSELRKQGSPEKLTQY